MRYLRYLRCTIQFLTLLFTLYLLCSDALENVKISAPTIKGSPQQKVTREKYNPVQSIQEEAYIFKALPQGDVVERKGKEQRWFTHSDRQPTGLYVEKGNTLTVITDEELSLCIGQFGIYAGLNNGRDINIKKYLLKSGRNTITYTEGVGMIYLSNTSKNTIKNVAILQSGVNQAPLFEKGKTHQEDFEQQLRQFSNAPFVELVGDHIYGTFKYSLVLQTLPGTDIESRIDYWDKGIEIQANLHGLSYNGTEDQKKADNKVHIANPDIGQAGKIAYAQDGYISMFGSSGEGILISEIKHYDSRNTVLWHEIGHTFQNPRYKPDYLTEVTNELYALVVQDEMGHGNNIKEKQSSNIHNYILKPDCVKNYTNDFPEYNQTPVGMFEQLRIAYGTEFYSEINDYYRKYSDHENWQSYGEDMQYFMAVSSRISQRNLTPFFKKWGLRPEGKALEQMSQLPMLEHKIWKNIYSKDVVDRRSISPLS